MVAASQLHQQRRLPLPAELSRAHATSPPVSLRAAPVARNGRGTFNGARRSVLTGAAANLIRQGCNPGDVEPDARLQCAGAGIASQPILNLSRGQKVRHRSLNPIVPRLHRCRSVPRPH
jgi:hypothetical protein